MGTIWEIINSPLGMTLVLSAVGWVVRKVRSSDAKKRQLLDIADQIFGVVEIMARARGWTGREKWKAFVSMLIDAARAELGREPTAKEMAAIELRVNRAAWLQKGGRVPRAALPLPAPESGGAP